MRELIKNLVGGIIGTGIILGIVYIIGMVMNFMETHTWAFVIMIIVDIILIFKMVGE